MFGDDATNTAQSGAVFVVACAWLAAYYLWLKPRGVLKTLPAATLYYDNLGLRPRSCFGSRFDFANFRDYEHLHTVFWVLKDMFWNRMWVTPWVVAFACTFGVGFDFVFLARRQPLECAVYTSQLLWVTANFAWASGEFFVPQHDEPIRLNRIDHEAAVTGRWWAQLLLVFAMIPGILCYGIYVPFFHGKCRQNEKIAEAVRLSPMHDVAAMT
ncbi:hypothetical protein M885DRAFT_52180 [Pelagophyceae sp. CCMP2097]|nr:hypothetical protein M885DRAFT_52180 [Pelagophyceae sp. CCMP2097]